jgi:hypothetical protein
MPELNLNVAGNDHNLLDFLEESVSPPQTSQVLVIYSSFVKHD